MFLGLFVRLETQFEMHITGVDVHQENLRTVGSTTRSSVRGERISDGTELTVTGCTPADYAETCTLLLRHGDTDDGGAYRVNQVPPGRCYGPDESAGLTPGGPRHRAVPRQAQVGFCPRTPAPCRTIHRAVKSSAR